MSVECYENDDKSIIITTKIITIIIEAICRFLQVLGIQLYSVDIAT